MHIFLILLGFHHTAQSLRNVGSVNPLSIRKALIIVKVSAGSVHIVMHAGNFFKLFYRLLLSKLTLLYPATHMMRYYGFLYKEDNICPSIRLFIYDQFCF